MQDFEDIGGDRVAGRRTLPIVAPEGSRIYTLFVLPLTSLALAYFWSLGYLCSVLFVSMGCGIGLRCFLVRDEAGDKITYRLYNVRILDQYDPLIT